MNLTSAIESYVVYSNTKQIQRNLRLMTPEEYHEQYKTVAKYRQLHEQLTAQKFLIIHYPLDG